MKWVGILGGGQLGLMLCKAAKQMGIDTVVFSAPGDNPAFREASAYVEASYDNVEMLDGFIRMLDGGPVTLEFENVPVPTLLYLEGRGVRTTPSSAVLTVAQDRALEKRMAKSLDIPTTGWEMLTEALCQNPADTCRLLPGIVKSTHGGYDGKSQHVVQTVEQLRELANTLDSAKGSWILERIVEFAYETSVIVARNSRGEMMCFPSGINTHKEGILYETYYSAGCIGGKNETKAKEYAKRLAAKMEVVGLLAVEYFVGLDGRVLFNEMAPRPHNSGHWTIEGCNVSQFTLCLEAICDLPLSEIIPAKKARMVNLLGKDIGQACDYIKHDWDLHHYGKTEIRPGRKMGHVTKVWR